MTTKKSRCFNSTEEKKAFLKWKFEQAEKVSAKAYIDYPGDDAYLDGLYVGLDEGFDRALLLIKSKIADLYQNGKDAKDILKYFIPDYHE